MLSKRAASLGSGEKMDISKLAGKGPSPNAYNMRSDFQRSKRGIGIGLGRDVRLG